MKNDYEILGIPFGASEDEIKSAHRKLVIQHHPDKGGDVNKFREIQEAYERLSGKKTKQKEDVEFDFNDINDLWGRMNARQRSMPQKGSDIHIMLELELQDILTPYRKEIKYQKYEFCSKCNATGSKNGQPLPICKKCKGSGFVSKIKNPNSNIMVQEAYPCNECQGNGKEKNSDNICEECKGNIFVLRDAVLNLETPIGINETITVEAKGFGHTGKNGGPYGNVYVRFAFKSHPEFTKDGADLYKNINISYADACKGCTVKIEALNKKTVELSIPSLSAHGTVLKIKELGLPVFSSDIIGDLNVVVNIKMPTEITEEYSKVLDELKKLENI